MAAVFTSPLLGSEWTWNSCKYLLHLSSEYQHSILDSTDLNHKTYFHVYKTGFIAWTSLAQETRQKNQLPPSPVTCSMQSSFTVLTSHIPSKQHRRVKRTDGSMAEQLSKNVTKILEDLLKDYDKTERPSFKTGTLML